MKLILSIMSYGYDYETTADSAAEYEVGYIVGWLIGIIIWGLIWGAATQAVINNKGYDESWFLWGFLFGFIAFLIALCKPSIPRISSSIEDERKKGYFHGFDSRGGTLFKGDAATDDGWTCVCGARNKDYEGTCHRCGKSKHEKKEARAAIQTAVDQRKITTSVDDTAQQIKDYKKLLDEGLITEEEFTAKKRSILGI